MRIDDHAAVIVNTAGDGKPDCRDFLCLEVVFCNQPTDQRLNRGNRIHRIARMRKRKRFLADEFVILANDARRDLASAYVDTNAKHAASS
ncbi:hypothetical protein SDC9_122706 [bioreactor metagenome]|uniref:Uncharacterized protein n=1 Tax=bioreactor metagenome TaxID=1076179 RepID=A0A645CFT3_9ZZZZ